MKIISYNVNGIRAAQTKGLIEWLKSENPDIFCIQEAKAQKGDVDISQYEAMGYEVHWFAAQKKGYSSVVVFSKIKFDQVDFGSGHTQSDFEGRVLICTHDNFTFINAYFPSGTTGGERQTYKYQWLDEIYDFVKEKLKSGQNIILCGDYNIAHTEIDIHDPKGNKNSSGFLPEERAWMDKFFALGMKDSFRLMHQNTINAYSWWSYRANARANNKGWRIDYISVNDQLAPKIKNAGIMPEVSFSDHCPIWIDIDL